MLTSGLALGLALWFLTTVGDKIMTAEGGGVSKEIVEVGAGYWLWLASIAVTFAGAFIVWLVESIVDSGVYSGRPSEAARRYATTNDN